MLVRKLMINRVVTLLWLIILPSILLIIVMHGYYYSSITIEPWTIAASLLFLIYTAAFLGYAPYHVDHYREIPKKEGVVEAVKEYQFSRKLFGVTAAIMIFLLILGGGRVFIYLYGQLSYLQAQILGFTILFVLVISSLATIILAIRFVNHYARKDFGFYLATAYYIVSFQEKNSIRQFKYLTLVLDTYNKFLERNLRLKIKNITHIYSIIMSASAEREIEIRESIGKALEKDELELARQIPKLFSLPDKEEFLIKESPILNQRFKEVLTVIIPAVISIVGFIIAMLTQLNLLRIPG